MTGMRMRRLTGRRQEDRDEDDETDQEETR